MKKKKLVYLYTVLLLLVLGMMYWLRPRHKVEFAFRDYPQIQAEGCLRILTAYGTDAYFQTADSLDGFQYELIRAIARLSGLETETRLETTLPASFKALDEGLCDVIALNLPATSELKEKYLLTEPLVRGRLVLVQRTAAANKGIAPIRDQLELAGKTVHVAADAPALLRLRNMEEEMADSLHIVENKTYSPQQLLFAVAQGEIDYAVCDRQAALALADSFPQVDLATDIGFTQPQAWAVRKTSPILRDSLNAWFERMRRSGLFESIYKKYYPD